MDGGPVGPRAPSPLMISFVANAVPGRWKPGRRTAFLDKGLRETTS